MLTQVANVLMKMAAYLEASETSRKQAEDQARLAKAQKVADIVSSSTGETLESSVVSKLAGADDEALHLIERLAQQGPVDFGQAKEASVQPPATPQAAVDQASAEFAAFCTRT